MKISKIASAVVLTMGVASFAAQADQGKRGAAKADDTSDTAKRDEDIVLRELVVLPGSSIVGLSASDMHLRTRYGLNLLAVHVDCTCHRATG